MCEVREAIRNAQPDLRELFVVSFQNASQEMSTTTRFSAATIKWLISMTGRIAIQDCITAGGEAC